MTRAFVLATCLVACDSGGPTDPEPPAAEGPRHATELADTNALAALADGDLAVKYLAPLTVGELPRPVDAGCVFQHMVDTAWHVEFLAAFPGWAGLDVDTYAELVLRRATRTMWGGAVRFWPEADAVSYSVYGEDGLEVDDVRAVLARLESCVGFGDRLVFARQGGGQHALVEALRAAGIAATDPATLAGEATEVYSPGVGFGTAVVRAAGEAIGDYGPRDVLVLESAPNDIAVVAGLVTEQPQNLHSHVNLRLGEKGVPNARWPGSTERLRPLDGRLVRIEAGPDGLDVRPTTVAEAEAWWAEHTPQVPAPEADLSVTAVRRFADLSLADGIAYGPKAAHLAELSRLLAPEHAPHGFAIPFAAYARHLTANGIDARIERFLADARRHEDPGFRAAALDDIRDAIRDAPVDPILLAEIDATVRSWLGDAAGSTRLRFRSSSNVEDLATLTGAGLYDSKSGDLRDPGKPLVRVWRSLWNDRAYAEREFYGVDHRLAYMGVAVNPSFVDERVNAVAVTHLRVDDGAPMYRVVSQVGTESVVRPNDPTAVAEVRTFRRAPDGAVLDDTTRVASSLAPGPLWSDADFAPLTTALFRAHDHFAALYGDAGIAFDLEAKITADGRVVLKQIRPYVQGDR